MTDERSFRVRWRAYRASKVTLFWSCVACVVVTIIVGFAWGGWVTSGTATKMAAKAANDARTDLVAAICVQRFLDASNARAQLTILKEQSSWQRDDFIEKGGWDKPPGIKGGAPGAASLCAQRLAAATLPPESQATNDSAATTVQ